MAATRLIVLALVGVSLVVGCGSGEGQTTAGGRLRVEASFYPLQWVAEQVGGRRVAVSSLTKPGAEPHDLELTPREVGAVQDAGAVIYLSGFQPSVDAAIGDAGGAVLDVRRAADLDLSVADEDGASGTDPHFWLDPIRLGRVAQAVERTLATAEPAHATEFRANGRALRARLGDLDADLRAGLRSCTDRDLVTSHEAFGYLAQRYGLHQVGITGLTPEAEPSPRALAKVADFVEDHHVRTIYFETLVSPAVAEAVAGETAARTAVLDPIETLDRHSDGDDYLAVMRSNLRSLRAGQPCR